MMHTFCHFPEQLNSGKALKQADRASKISEPLSGNYLINNQPLSFFWLFLVIMFIYLVHFEHGNLVMIILSYIDK